MSDAAAVSFDVVGYEALGNVVAEHDLLVSLIPYSHHVPVIKAVMKDETHVVTTNHASPATRELDATAAKASGVVVTHEIGLDTRNRPPVRGKGHRRGSWKGQNGQ